MNFIEIYKNENNKVIEEFKDSIEKIKIISQCNNLEGNFNDYFKKISEFIMLLKKITDNVYDNKINSLTIEELKEINNKLYDDILGENYEKSFANPKFAVETFGEDLGKLLSFIYVNIRNKIEDANSYRLFNIVSAVELFIKVYDILSDDKNSVIKVKSSIVQYAYDKLDIERDMRSRRFVDTSINYIASIIKESDLKDLRYLYKYDSYITHREIKTAQFFNSLSEEKVEAMTKVYTNGFVNGYINNNLNLKKKKYIMIMYSIGFERLALKASKSFESMGLDVIFELEQPYYTNRQYKYDHRYDYAIYLSKDYIETYLKVFKEKCEKYSEGLGKFAGPAVIETFGAKGFEPENKKEAISLSKKQRDIDTEFNRKIRVISAKYMKDNESSFTIISYPIPEIGEKFEEIFEETIKVNTLDNKLYKKIQQNIIDVLDKGDYVHVLGMGKNKTDLKVNLYKLKDPSKETIFQNGGADVNIPVGEVFTSPVLKGTNGKLHVSEVFLSGLSFKELEINLKDGMIDSYICKNFEDEDENKKLVNENILFNHESIPIGEFAIGTNTTAYAMGQKFNIADKLPILIAEKTGPHFAMGDTCYSMGEDNKVYNPDGKEIVAKDNEISLLRKTDISQAYFSCHTDITIPYDELYEISVYTKTGEKTDIIKNGKFVLPGTEQLNEALN